MPGDVSGVPGFRGRWLHHFARCDVDTEGEYALLPVGALADFGGWAKPP